MRVVFSSRRSLVSGAEVALDFIDPPPRCALVDIFSFHIYPPTCLRSDIDREVVGVALSYFDRFVSNHNTIAENLFRLVAMTSLYLAVKVHSHRKISVSSMVSSRFYLICSLYLLLTLTSSTQISSYYLQSHRWAKGTFELIRS